MFVYSICLFVSYLENSILEKNREVPIVFYKKCKIEWVKYKKRQICKETNSYWHRKYYSICNHY